jgi:hypothetical protein
MKGFQVQLFPLRTPTFAVGGTDVTPLDVLPTTLSDGLIAHLVGFIFDVSTTPTIGGGNTASVYGQNNLVELVEFNDGLNLRCRASFNELRFREYLENGRLIMPDPDAAATGESPQYRRFLPVGPVNMAGSPSDFMLPTACLEGGSLQWNFLSADSRYSAGSPTFASTSVRVTALLVGLRNELRIPPLFEWNRIPAGQADVAIPGHSLYTHLGMVDTLSTPGTAITAGDFSSVGIDTGKGSIRSQDVQAYGAAFSAMMGSGHINGLYGEPRATQDDNTKMVNSGTPTALTAASPVLQPVIHTPPETRITKCAYEAGSQLRVVWSGSQSTAGLVYGRIVEQSDAAEAALAARGIDRLKRKPHARVCKTLSKEPYVGSREGFLPHAYKLG